MYNVKQPFYHCCSKCSIKRVFLQSAQFFFSVIAFMWRPKSTVSDQRFLWKLLLCNSTILCSYTLETWMHDCSFSWALCLIINAMCFSLRFVYQKHVHYIIFSLILRHKGPGGVVLFQLLVADSPDCLHVSTSKARRSSGIHRLLPSFRLHVTRFCWTSPHGL